MIRPLDPPRESAARTPAPPREPPSALAFVAFAPFRARAERVAQGERATFDRGFATDSEAASAFAELAAFLEGAVAVTGDAPALAAWAERSGSTPCEPVVPLGALLAALPSDGDELPADAPPEAMRRALERAVERSIALPAEALAAVAVGLDGARERLEPEAPELAASVALALALADRPSAWADAASGLADGRVARALSGRRSLDRLLEEARPRCARDASGDPVPSLPPHHERVRPLDDADLALVERAFERELPLLFAERSAESPAAGAHASSGYRPSQHALAREIARSLGAGELLLLHAPTGTGKTLAYLVPALLWAWRNDVRVAVATYTRALQEQAHAQDLPLAREALRRIDPAIAPRATLLKGRSNYLCWRALLHQRPLATDDGAYWLAWTRLLAHAFVDPDGDLDRLAALGSLEGVGAPAAEHAARELGRILRESRAESGCCSSAADRATCAAEVARRRAERAHLVVTNHAFVLTRKEFQKHVVFDECEHLHEQAQNAWSHELPLRDLERVLARPHRGGAVPRGPLARLADAAPEGSELAGAAAEAIEVQARALSAFDRFGGELARFEVWRERKSRERHERDRHSLFREHVESEEGAPLLEAHVDLCRASDELAAGLAAVSEELDSLPRIEAGRVRRSLDLARAELEERLAALRGWIPTEEGAARFLPEVFYDVGADARGRPTLLARVLLPHEFLGRLYHPELESGAFLSATTWLKGGFGAAAAYLGLERAADPAPGEERAPCVLRTFRAPEVFDYGRVCVCVPRDAPAVHADKRCVLDYTARFLAHLVERTRGRTLALFTNADDCRRVGERLRGELAPMGLPILCQGLDGRPKEALATAFRARPEAVLLGVDTFWFGADFPGETLEYLVLCRLPYGVPDRYHHAQSAVLGSSEQRRGVYLPRALAKFRQGFGRLLRRESDRGCVFLLDARVLEPRHRAFLRELPLADPLGAADAEHDRTARLVRGDTERCLEAAFEHMGLASSIAERGLATPFRWSAGSPRAEPPPSDPPPRVEPGDVPF